MLADRARVADPGSVLRERSTRPGLALAAADLVLGAACPGCGVASRAVCARCLGAMRPTPSTVHRRPVRVVAAGVHGGVLQRTVVAWKEVPTPSLAPVLAHLLAASVCELLEGADETVLVPVPSSRRSRRARGADVVDQLTAATRGVLDGLGVRATVARGLRMSRQTADQSGLGARERAANLAGAFVAVPRRLRPGSVVVVDDVVTTGATLRVAVRALRAHDVPVLGAATVSARP